MNSYDYDWVIEYPKLPKVEDEKVTEKERNLRVAETLRREHRCGV